MALSDRWSRSTLRTVVRRELMDPNAQWWSNDELNGYLQAWQDRLQEEFEFVWGTATATITASTGTATLADIATDILRVDAFYWNEKRLVVRNKEDLDILSRNWRNANAATPYVVYQDSLDTIGFYPPNATAGTLVLEYPQILTLSTDTSTMDIPAWTRYSAANYCAYRAYLRFGANQDLERALRRRGKFYRQVERYRVFKANHFPDKYLSLRPGSPYGRRTYELDILQPEPPDTGVVTVSGTLTRGFYQDETPTGTVNGVNDTFTLTETPNPASSLALYVDGVRLYQGTHYNISGLTITFVAAYIPTTGQTLWASYRYS